MEGAQAARERQQNAKAKADADLRIVELTEKLADVQAELDQLKPKAPVLNLSE